jgi:RNase P/RNase MRP subunit POP5
VEKIRKLILSVNHYHGEPLEIHILGVSGTLRALRRKYMRKQAENIPKVIKVVN